MPTIVANGIDIWYERTGDGKPLLVLTHGFAGPYFPPVVDELRPHVNLLLYHVRAHGKTTTPDDAATVNFPQFSVDLAALLDALDIERAHIGGVSMGGMVSAQFACDHPGRVRSLLLCDTTAGNGHGPNEEANATESWMADLFAQMARIVEKHGLRELAERENRYRHGDDPHAGLQVKTLDEQDAENIANKTENMTQAGYLAANRAVRERPDLTSRTPAIAAPTLVSCGEWDRFYACARRDASLIPNARFVTIRGAAHDTLAYQPQLWKSAVLSFIADVEDGRDVRGELVLEAEAEGRPA